MIVFNSPLAAVELAASISPITSSRSHLISPWNAFQAAFCAARASVFAFASIASISSSVAIGVPPGLKLRIHLRNCTLQSYSLYQLSNSLLL